MNNTEVAYFITSITLGTLIFQNPIGRLSNKFDRRAVILGATIIANLAISVASLFGSDQFIILPFTILIFDGLVFSLYLLSIAHANDYLTSSQMVATSSGLLMVNGAGTVTGSPLAAAVIEIAGTRAFMLTIGGLLFIIAGFVLYRMHARSAVPAKAQGTFVAIPDASIGIAVNLSPEIKWVMD